MIWLSNSCVGSLDWNLFFNCFAESSKSWIMKLGKVPQDVPTIWRNNKICEAPDIHELHEHQTKTANIDSIIDWLYNLLKQIWSISALGVLGYQRPGCGWTTLPLQASYDRMMVALSQKLPEIPMITLWPGDFVGGSAMVRPVPFPKHLEPSCWSVLDHRLWCLQAVYGNLMVSSDVSFCGASRLHCSFFKFPYRLTKVKGVHPYFMKSHDTQSTQQHKQWWMQTW